MKKTIYLFSNGTLRRKANTIYIETEDGRKRYLPVENTSAIMVFGELSVNKKLLEFLSQKEILLHFFSHYGYYMGTFYPREHYNSGYMILKQAEFYLCSEKRLTLAKSFVRGASTNMLKVLRYYLSRGKVNLQAHITAVENLKERIPQQTDTNKLMAIEGNIRDTYYSAFNEIIADPEFHIQQRSKRPPTTRINALISFGNSLLYSTVLSEIYKTPLDPRIGFLHATNFRRFTLNLDIAEVFKPVIVDRVIFSILNKQMLKKKHFLRELEGMYLNEKGRELFVREYEDKLSSTIKHDKLKKNVSYRSLIRMELYKLEKHFIGEEQYEPFAARW